MREKKQKNTGEREGNAGFTLIEMLVTILIVGVGLVGMLSFFSVNLENQFEVKNEIIAANLAQEGMELVKNIRDYNVLNSGNLWDTGLNSSCKTIDFKSVTDANPLIAHHCDTSGAINAVCVDANSRYYQCASGNTGFTRTILISDPNPDTSRTITCTVSWGGRKTEAIDFLYNNNF